MACALKARQLIIVLGDQLDARSVAFDGLDRKRDAVWMTEVADEATHVCSQKARIAIFLSAMRHFRDWLRKRDITASAKRLGKRSTTAMPTTSNG